MTKGSDLQPDHLVDRLGAGLSQPKKAISLDKKRKALCSTDEGLRGLQGVGLQPDNLADQLLCSTDEGIKKQLENSLQVP
eukprot:1162141-Pelagomonas_calceolata.AAC.3